MAITWGSTVHVGNGIYQRIGIDAKVSYPGGALDKSDTQATISGDVWVQFTNGWGQDQATWSTSGISGSGSIYYRTTSTGQTYKLGSFSGTKSLIYGSSQSVKVTASLNNAALPDPPSVSKTVTVGARPYYAPAAPSSFSASRSSDARQNLSWTRNATTAAPYSNIEVYRSTNGGSYTRIATISGSATSYADTKTAANNRYTYRVRATNSAGSSSYSNSDAVSTTPATPGRPSATKSGADIVVTRPSLSSVASTWEVREAGGGTLVTGRSAGLSTWTHSNPSATQAWSYEIRAVSTDPVLYSGWSPASTTIQLIAPPLAPTGLLPLVADADEDIVLSWDHNPVDTTGQRKYEIETRPSSADPWTSLGVVTSSTTEHVITAGTWENGGDREWRVFTWGQHANRSPASDASLMTLSARPVVGITYPGATHDSQRLRLQWTYYDQEGADQVSWRATLSSNDVLVYIRSGSGPATEVDLNYDLENGATYTATLEALDGAGLWSAVDSVTFSVDYAPPMTPWLEASWYSDDGYVAIQVDVPDIVGTERPLDHVRIERATPEGWFVVADQLPGQTTVTDMIPPTATAVTYRAVAVSDIESESSATTVVETHSDWVFINHGPGFGQVVRVWGNLSLSRGYTPTKVLRKYAGRKRPLVRGGPAVDESYDLSATLFAPWADPDPSSTWDDVKDAVDADLVCVRDPEGNRIFCTATSTNLGKALEVHRDVSIPLTLVEYEEPVR